MTGFKGMMEASAAERRSKVVLALDLWGPYDSRLARAEAVLQATMDGIAGVKVNQHLLLPYGLQGLKGVIDTCRKERLPLIADLKLNDIEATNLNAVESLIDFGFNAVIVNPFVGRDEGLGKVVEWVHSRGGGVIFLVYMSHAGSREGFGLRLQGGEPVYRVFAERARGWGADGVVVSAKSIETIAEVRGVVGKDCLILSPGIGAQGGKADTWATSQADFMMVGRAITESDNPAGALRSLTER